MAASGGERAIDVRGLPPCEPMERILATCDALQPGQRLRALLSREPLPLFPILARRGLAWRVLEVTDDRCELLVWPAGEADGAVADRDG